MFSLGYVAWIGSKAEKDSVLVETLYGLGAVPFVRTNVPQTLMARIGGFVWQISIDIIFSGGKHTTMCSEERPTRTIDL